MAEAPCDGTIAGRPREALRGVAIEADGVDHEASLGKSLRKAPAARKAFNAEAAPPPKTRRRLQVPKKRAGNDRAAGRRPARTSGANRAP